MFACAAPFKEPWNIDSARRFWYWIFVASSADDVPFDRIKIDKSFTQNMIKRSDSAAIISATLTLAKSLDIATTAEGVETEDQSRLLRLAGVNSLQGFLFKRPSAAAEIDFDCIYGSPEIENAA